MNSELRVLKGKICANESSSRSDGSFMIGLKSSQPNMRLHLILIFRLTWIMGEFEEA